MINKENLEAKQQYIFLTNRIWALQSERPGLFLFHGSKQTGFIAERKYKTLSIDTEEVKCPRPGLCSATLDKLCNLSEPQLLKTFPCFIHTFLTLFFNWRKIALQCCDGFCHKNMKCFTNLHVILEQGPC